MDLSIIEETLRRLISVEEDTYPALAEAFVRILADVIDETEGVDLDDF